MKAKRHWVFRSLLILSGCILSAIGIYQVLENAMTMFQPDHFADHLEIPNNIELNIPLDEQSDSNSNHAIERTKKDFELYKTELSGIYGFNLWFGEIEEGTVYLKAFEVTSDYNLSPDEIRQTSAMNILNHSDKVEQFGTTYFTVSEGDWGQFYAARFEVWFIPNDRIKERLLLSKIYKIEGYSN